MGDTSETNTKVLSRELFLGVVALKCLYRKIIICAIRSLFPNLVTYVTYYSVWMCHYSYLAPHAQRERGKVIGCGVHIYICLWTKKIFGDRLTFSNIRSRTSRRIYRLALPLRAPETLSSLSKSRISIFNAHLTLVVRSMTSHNSIGKYRHLVN